MAWARAEALAQKAAERFSEVADLKFGLQTRYLQKDDQMRLLNLWRQIETLKLPYEEAVEALLQYWTEKTPVGNKFKSRTLPVRIWNLTGKRSARVLQEYLQSHYPAREHLSLWRQEMKATLMEKIGRKEGDASVPYDSQSRKFRLLSSKRLARDYRQTLAEEREEENRILERLQNRPRPWRGNPWKE